jgi:hypothetical protein
MGEFINPACHCEKRSDEAISMPRFGNHEIAAASGGALQ